MTKPRKPPTKRRPSRTIPEHLRAAVLDQLKLADPATGKPHTTRSVAAWLGEVHGVKCSYMAVVRLRAAADERGDALIVEALRETLRDLVGPTASKLRRSLTKLDTLVRASRSVKDVAAATNAEARALREVARLGGVAAVTQVDLTSGGKPLPDAYSLLAERAARLVEEDDASATGAVPGEPDAA